jgi:hypothetical protein
VNCKLTIAIYLAVVSITKQGFDLRLLGGIEEEGGCGGRSKGVEVDLKGDEVNFKENEENLEGDEVNLEGDKVNLEGDEENL